MRPAPRSLAFIALALAAFALTACGEGGALDESLKGGARGQLIATCEATAEGQLPEGVSVDLNALCGCAADKVMADKSMSELASNPPSPSDAIAAVRQCASEIGGVKLDPAGALAGEAGG